MSIVRENMLTQLGYVPYCGNSNCRHQMPRTRFDGEQMTCRCGWRSEFDQEFIQQYKHAQAKLAEEAKRRSAKNRFLHASHIAQKETQQ